MSRCTVVTKLPSPVAHSCGFLNNLNSFCRGMFKLNAKLDAALLLYLLSHFECSSHKIYMLTQHCLLSTLSSAVKSSMFTHVHSSPLSLAARLHWCHTNHSCYINNGCLLPNRPHIFLLEKNYYRVPIHQRISDMKEFKLAVYFSSLILNSISFSLSPPIKEGFLVLKFYLHKANPFPLTSPSISLWSIQKKMLPYRFFQ